MAPTTSAGLLACLLVNSSISLTLTIVWLEQITSLESAREEGGGKVCGLQLPNRSLTGADLVVAGEIGSLLSPRFTGDGYQPRLGDFCF